MGLTRPNRQGLDLVVGFRDSPDPDRLAQWKIWIRHGARLLEQATSRQLRVRTVYLANGPYATHEADLVIVRSEGRATSPVGAAGSPGMFQLHHEDDIESPLVLVHEFGHYALGLLDEANCQGDPMCGACIMEFSDHGDRLWFRGRRTSVVQGEVWAFCTPANHGRALPGPPTGPSCWQTIADVVPGVAVPSGPRVAPRLPRLRFVQMQPAQRVALVLASRAPGAKPAFDAVRRFWEAVTAGTDVNVQFVESACGGAGEIDVVSAVGDGFERVRGRDECASRVVLLFADGAVRDVARLQTLRQQLRRERVRVFCACMRRDDGFGTLLDLTAGTSGRLECCATVSDSWSRARDFAVECYGEIVDGVGMAAWTVIGGGAGPPSATVCIEAGSRRVVIVVGSDGTSAEPPAVRLVRAGGNPQILEPGSAVMAAGGLTAFVVDGLAAGAWDVQLDSAGAPYTLMAFSTNPQIHIGCHGMWRPVKAGQPTQVVARTVDFGQMQGDAGAAAGSASSAAGGAPTDDAGAPAPEVGLAATTSQPCPTQPIHAPGADLLLSHFGSYHGTWSRAQVGSYAILLCVDETIARPFRRVRRFQIHVV